MITSLPLHLFAMILLVHALGTLALNIVSTWLIILAIIGTAFYLFLKQKYKFWERKGIPGPKPEMPFGSFKEALLVKCTEPEALNKYSKKFIGEKYIGIYLFWKPIVFVKDLELARRIVETDFVHFTDHPDNNSNVNTDAVLDSLFTMHGQVWKSRRAQFSKLFTPAKLKEYSEEIESGLSTVFELLDGYEKNSGEVEIVQALEDFVIYSVVYGMLGLDTLQNTDKNEIIKKMVDIFMTPSVPSVIKFLCYGMYPKFFRFIGLTTLDKRLWEISSKFVLDLFSHRMKSDQARNDCVSMVMNLMAEAGSNKNKITFEEAVGHIFSFIQAGNHTTLTTACHILFNLARHPDVQEKVRAEIEEVMNGPNDTIYEKIRRMSYLDNVIRETIRLCPLLGTIKRTCTKTYKIDEKLTVPEGMDVYIDVIHIHMNPEFFPEPEKFMPERWTNGQAEPLANMTFGRGPRICIGKRFAEIELKILITAILSRYILLPSEKMEPMKFDPRKLFVTVFPLNGIWIKLRRIEQPSNILNPNSNDQ